MGTVEQQENYAFAESVRRQALRIATLLAAGKVDAATDSALALCTAGQREKRRITGTPEPEPVSEEDEDEDGEGVQANYDLQSFNAEYRQDSDGPKE